MDDGGERFPLAEEVQWLDDLGEDNTACDHHFGDDGDQGVEADESIPHKGLTSRSDEPVRMYLTEVGKIPLPAREQELALAKRIELRRARLRR